MYTVQSTNVGLAATAMMVGAVTSDALLEKVFFFQKQADLRG